MMKEEIVRENQAKDKRRSAWTALQSLAKDHELAQRLKEKRQDRLDFFTKRDMATRSNLRSR